MGPPSPCWLSPRPARRRRPDFTPHEENHGRPTRRSRLQDADSKKPAPIKRSRPYPQSLHPPSGDETGRGYSEACHPRIPEHAWHSAPYGVAMTRPARHCCHVDPDVIHDGLPVRPTGGGPLRAERHPKAAWPPPVGPRRSRLSPAGLPPPRRRRPIKETRRGEATVVTRRTAAL